MLFVLLLQAGAAVAQALSAMKHMAITKNPNLKAPAPVFVPKKQPSNTTAPAGGKKSTGESKPQQQQQQQGKVKQKQGHQGSSSSGEGKGGTSNVAPSLQRGRGWSKAGSRVQDDDVFDEFGAELLYEEVVSKAG